MASLTWLKTEDIEKLAPLVGVAAETVLTFNVVSGWIFNPDHELTFAQLYLNGEPLALLPLFERPDVAELYPRFPNALHSGYYFIIPARLIRTDDISRITAVGYADKQPLGRIRGIAFPEGFLPKHPTPPVHLSGRSQGSTDAATYESSGYRLYRDVLDAVAPHGEQNQIRRVLDWGCGSGRVATHLISDSTRRGYTVHACDPHADSIAWCRENLPQGLFDVSSFEPPLGYADSSFDLIIGLGVIYLFSKDELVRWFQELRRIIADGGRLVLSVQGTFSARLRFPVEGVNRLLREGVCHVDDCDNPHLPPSERRLFRAGYYWTPEHFKRTAAPYFRVLDYLEGAYTVDQDLVVLEPVT